MTTLPVPEKVLVAALKASSKITTAGSGGRVATRLSGTFPAIRVTLLGGPPRLAINTGLPEFQVECWAGGMNPSDEAAAADLVAAVEAAVEDGDLIGTYPSGKIIGAFMVGGVIHSPDPTTQRERYLLTMGLVTQ